MISTAGLTCHSETWQLSAIPLPPKLEFGIVFYKSHVARILPGALGLLPWPRAPAILGFCFICPSPHRLSRPNMDPQSSWVLPGALPQSILAAIASLCSDSSLNVTSSPCCFPGYLGSLDCTSQLLFPSNRITVSTPSPGVFAGLLTVSRHFLLLTPFIRFALARDTWVSVAGDQG